MDREAPRESLALHTVRGTRSQATISLTYLHQHAARCVAEAGLLSPGAYSTHAVGPSARRR